MSVPNSPIEVVSHIAGYLSKKELTSTALVCRAWVAGVLPKLYSSVSLHYCSQFERFASTLLSAGPEGGLVQISFYVKELWIQSDDSEADKSGLAVLHSCVPKLARLRELAWNLSYAPKNSKLITLFQTQCAELCAVKVSIPDVFEFKSELKKPQYATLLGFKNIVDFRLSMNCIPAGIATKCAGPLKALLLNSPNLRSLEICFWEDGEDKYSIDQLFVSLGSEVVLPSLRRLELSGSVEIDETTLFSPPNQGYHPFRNFLCRHP